MLKTTFGSIAVFFVACVAAQSQSVSEVILRSTASDRTLATVNLVHPELAPVSSVKPATNGVLPQGLFTIYAVSQDNVASPPSDYIAKASAIGSAISSNIAVALSLIPLSSPSSGVILKNDPVTGAALPVSGTLGPIFTQRAESIGKGKFYLGFTHQNFHYTSFEGQSLNGLSIQLAGGTATVLTVPNTSPKVAVSTAPVTMNLGLDVRLSQDVAFLTYGVTNHFDISLGLPMVHAAVASTAYNGISYSGSGFFNRAGSQCWCATTFTPGSFSLAQPVIGHSSLGKTGFGDVLLRFKDTVIERPNAVLAVGTDLRLPSGDDKNFLGTGTTSVKPFLALALYSSPFFKGIVFAPHVDVAWQFSGKSILGGTLNGTDQVATLADGSKAHYLGLPITASKDSLPDIFSWAVGTEIAMGRHNTLIVDILGNQIGLVHGAQLLRSQGLPSGFDPPLTDPNSGAVVPQTSGLVDAGHGSFGQYSGAFGYKTRLIGNLVATFQVLVRFDHNGLEAHVVPLYGIGYSF